MKKLEKGLDFAMSTIMSIVMLVLLIFGTWQIFTRWVLNDPSTFTEEMLRYLLIWAGMIGAAYCFWRRFLMRSSSFCSCCMSTSTAAAR